MTQRTITIGFAILLIAAGAPVRGGTTVIQNEVNVSATTGGQQGSGTTGEARASATVETVVDGETVESVAVTIEATGEEKTVARKTATSSHDGTVVVDTQIEVNVSAAADPPGISGAPAATSGVPTPQLPILNSAAPDTESQRWWPKLFEVFVNLFRHVFRLL